MQDTKRSRLVAALVMGLALTASGVAAETGLVGSADAAQLLSLTVQEATAELASTGTALLPAGTCLDATEWVDNVLYVYLTVPTGAVWRLGDVDAEDLTATLAQPYVADPSFGGLSVRVRSAADEPYGSLERYIVRATPADVRLEPTERPGPLASGPRIGGPVAQAGRQPTGALSNVVVFASAGHGWTAGESAWYLQRPVLLGMCEDYGNIDQLNYFMHYAFNAGATVVPFRPTGWQPIEIVLDNDDPGVTYTGTWSDGSSAKYYENGTTMSGIAYKWATAATTESATARFTPNITVTDFYPVYCFTIAGSNRTKQTYRVAHSGGVVEIPIDHRQVGNGWIWLGDYYLEAGGNNYVEITNESDEAGAIIADAIRWGGGVGDIVRPGPGSISGYTRDEECQRYWAEGELGFNAIGFDSYIWDIPGADDGSDNVRTGAKWAREMNQEPAGGVLVDRWKRIHLEFHTNASGGAARGQICLITDLGATTYQTQFATILSDEVDADMLVLDDEFEHTWYDRASATYTSSYGAICTEANGDEFDATIVELAFHDNQQDAELLRDSRIRAAMARSCVQGIIRFLSTLPGSQVPVAFAPDTPRNVRLATAPNGDVTLAWDAPLFDGARGDPATGYVVYQSSNGYGFGSPTVLGNVLTATFTDLPVGETRYYRVAATNAGGESMPSELLAVRKSATDGRKLLIVNGFDRLRRQINPIQTFTQPAAYAGLSIERQIWRQSNSFDYVVQHAEALAAGDYAFDSCANECVGVSQVLLDNYDAVVWILGTESSEDATLTTTEQTRIRNYLLNNHGVFLSGAEMAYDLVGLAHGTTFMADTLHVGYVGDDANTYQVVPPATGILAGLPAFDFNPTNGACYDVRSPDVLSAGTNAAVCLNYAGGTGGAAGIQYESGFYNVVAFGFPFETISSPTVRADVMVRVAEFILNPGEPLRFDYNRDNQVTMYDFNVMLWCWQGPGNTYPAGHTCINAWGEFDLDIDLEDFAALQDDFGS